MQSPPDRKRNPRPPAEDRPASPGKEAEAAANAFLFGLRRGLHFQVAAVVAWPSVTQLTTAAGISAAHRRFLNRAGVFCRDHGGKVYFVWASERTAGYGLHHHYVFSVPPDHVDEFATGLGRWVQPGTELPPRAFSAKRSPSLRTNIAWFKDLMKTTGTVDRMPWKLAGDPETPGYLRFGRRAGYSWNLAPNARLAGGWAELPAASIKGRLQDVFAGHGAAHALTPQQIETIEAELIRRGLWRPRETG